MAIFTPKPTTIIAAGKVIITSLWHWLFDNTQYLKDRMDSHVHNGSDGSMLLRVGGNLLRNGSFEDDITGVAQPTSWTFTPYTGGAGAVSATNAHGKQSYAITSTVLANGGGELLSNEFIECGAGEIYPWQAFFWGYGAAAAATMTIANPCVVTMTNHGLVANQAIVFTTTGALPTGIAAGQIYYVSATGLAASTFQFSATAGGASIATSGAQSGVHTVTRCTSGKLQAAWYDQAKAQVSVSDLWSSTNLDITPKLVEGVAIAPGAARYVKFKAIGGIPNAANSSVGTVWIDGVRLGESLDNRMEWNTPGVYQFVMPKDRVFIQVQGGGGSSIGNGYSGGGGGYGEGWVCAPAGTVVSVTVGAGVLYTANATGGTSSFGTFLSALGGISNSGAGGTTSPAPAAGVGFTTVVGGVGGLYAPGGNGYEIGSGASPYGQTIRAGIRGGGGAHSAVLANTGPGGDGFVAVRW